MSTRVQLNKKFIRKFDKLDHKIKDAFQKRFHLFLVNPFDPQLNNHSLTGTLKGYRSINITGDWRALYIEDNGIMIFEMIGTHSQLYK